MSRIRTIKPEAFTNEKLWDVDAAHPGMHLFRAFCGLWCAADREGRFEWRPRPLKAAVLPYWDGDFAVVLDVLEKHGFLRSYDVDGKRYGWIPSFVEHQRPNKHETQSVIPEPPSMHMHARASICMHVGKGKEGKGNGKEGEGERASVNDVANTDAQVPAVASDRETPCPTDLTERAERAGIPEQFAKAYRAPIEAVRQEIRETLTYWTIGGGAGRRKKNWLAVVRTRLHERGKSGALNVPVPEPKTDPSVARAKREAAERQAAEARRREVSAAVGGSASDVAGAKAALAALVGGT